LNQLNQKRYDGQNEKHVNEPAERIGADDAQHPQHDQDKKDCPKHIQSSEEESS
jgi:hypothetical protein